MDECDKLTLRSTRVKIVHNVDYDDIRDEMISCWALDPDNDERIRVGITRRDKTRILMDMLPMKGPTAFRSFIKCLEDCEQEYSHIVELIKDTHKQISIKYGYPMLQMRDPPMPERSEPSSLKVEHSLSAPSTLSSYSGTPDPVAQASYSSRPTRPTSDQPISAQQQQYATHNSHPNATPNPAYQQHYQQPYTTPNQPQYTAPYQPQYTAPYEPQYTAPNQQQYTASYQPQYTATNRPQYTAPIQEQYTAPIQQQYRAPYQQQYTAPYQQPYVDSPRQSAREQDAAPILRQHPPPQQATLSPWQTSQMQRSHSYHDMQSQCDQPQAPSYLLSPLQPGVILRTQSYQNLHTQQQQTYLDSQQLQQSSNPNHPNWTGMGTSSDGVEVQMQNLSLVGNTSLMSVDSNSNAQSNFLEEIEAEFPNSGSREVEQMLIGRLAPNIPCIKAIGLCLGIKIPKIQQIQNSYPHSIQNQALELLVHWTQSSNDLTTIEKLVTAFRHVKLDRSVYESVIKEYLMDNNNESGEDDDNL